MKIDWKAKLSSRKFWALIAALAVSILSGLVSAEVVTQVTSVISAVGACIAYMLAEAKVDAGRLSGGEDAYAVGFNVDSDTDDE